MVWEGIKETVLTAAAPTLERIRRDRLRLSHRLAKLLVYVEEHLLDPQLSATRAWQAAGIRDHTLSVEFRDITGTSLKLYIEGARIEIADRLLRSSDLEIGVIGREVGYSYHTTFTAAYRRCMGKTPSQARIAPSICGASDPLAGELSTSEAWVYLKRLRQAYPELETPPPRRTIVDGQRYEQLYAEDLWRRIRDLSPEEKRKEVRAFLFCSPVFFDLLRRKSRLEGRCDRQRGIELAKLALISLEDSEEAHGDKIHDLRALGWAWLGNAHRLALDFVAAEQSFAVADEEWRQPRAEVDQKIVGEICFLEGSLRMFQRRYEEALELVDRSRWIARAYGNRSGEAEALIQAASIHTYSSRLEAAITTLGAAQNALNCEEDLHLAFIGSANLANLLARGGDYCEATEALDIAKSLHSGLEDPLGVPQLQWIEANIRHGLGEVGAAERLYLEAEAGFEEFGHNTYQALTCLDRAILHTESKQWDVAFSMATKIVPVLRSLELYPETTTAIAMLAKALLEIELSQQVLQGVRHSMRLDPLVQLAR